MPDFARGKTLELPPREDYHAGQSRGEVTRAAGFHPDLRPPTFSPTQKKASALLVMDVNRGTHEITQGAPSLAAKDTPREGTSEPAKRRPP